VRAFSRTWIIERKSNPGRCSKSHLDLNTSGSKKTSWSNLCLGAGPDSEYDELGISALALEGSGSAACLNDMTGF
jgi:hypothetical protein